MDPSKVLLLEFKQNAGLASQAESDLLDSLPVVTGCGLVTPRPARDADAWVRAWGLIGQGEFLTPEPARPLPADVSPHTAAALGQAPEVAPPPGRQRGTRVLCRA